MYSQSVQATYGAKERKTEEMKENGRKEGKGSGIVYNGERDIGIRYTVQEDLFD